MYGDTYQSVRIDQRCIFCGGGTAEVQEHSYYDYQNQRYMKSPFPAHAACLKKARRVDTAIKWMWFLAFVAAMATTYVMMIRNPQAETTSPLQGLVILFGYLVPILYFTLGKKRRWIWKIKHYYETHRFGDTWQK